MKKASKGEDGVSALDRPEHARVFEALCDEGFAGGFDDARADEQALVSEVCVTHGVGVVKKVVQFGKDLLAALRISWGAFANSCHQGFDSALVEQFEPEFLMRRSIGLRQQQAGDLIQVFSGMKEVDDLDRIGEVRLHDGMVVVGSIGKHHHR